MDKQAFVKAMDIVMQGSMDVTKERIGTRVRHTGSLTLSEEDKLLLIQCIMQTHGCTVEEAVRIFKAHFDAAFRASVDKGGSSIWLVVLLLFAFGGLARDTAALIAPGILVLLLLATLWYLLTARKRAMKKTWKQHLETSDGLYQGLEKLVQTGEKSSFALAGKPILIVLLAGIVCAGYFSVEPYLPVPLYRQIAIRVVSAQANSDYESIAMTLDGMSPGKAEKTLNKAFDDIPEGAEHSIRLAQLAQYMAAEGSIGADAADALASRALSTVNVARLDTPYEAGLLPGLMERADQAAVEGVVARVGAQPEIFPETAAALGRYYADRRDTAGLLTMSESLGGQEFLRGALENDSVEDMKERLAQCEDAQQLGLLARSAAVNYVQPNDVLAFLRIAGDAGLTPTECYPEGAKLDWDLTGLKIYEYTEDMLDHSKWLVVTMTEAPEKMEFRSVPKEEYTIGSEFESVIEAGYEGNNALGKDAYEIILDTALMELIPSEYIPDTVEELDSLLVMSTLYVRDGTLRNTQYSTPIDNAPLTSKYSILWQRDYPTYSAVQLVDLYDMHTGVVDYRFRSNVVGSPEIPQKVLSKYMNDNGLLSLGSSEIEKYYIGLPDAGWSESAKAEVVQLLTDCEWSLDLAIMLDLYEYELDA